MLYRSVYRTPVQVRAFAVQILNQALFHAAAVLSGGKAGAGVGMVCNNFLVKAVQYRIAAQLG